MRTTSPPVYESCSSAAQYCAAQNVDRWITSRSVLTRITRKSNGPRATLHGAAQQRIWIPSVWHEVVSREFAGAFRDNVRLLLEEHFQRYDVPTDGRSTWQTTLMGRVDPVVHRGGERQLLVYAVLRLL
jgi:hypothetical protein